MKSSSHRRCYVVDDALSCSNRQIMKSNEVLEKFITSITDRHEQNNRWTRKEFSCVPCSQVAVVNDRFRV